MTYEALTYSLVNLTEYKRETAPAFKPIPPRLFPNLSLPCSPPFSLLLLLLDSLPALPLLLPRPLGGQGVGPGLGLSGRQVEGTLELLELPQELAALLGGHVLGSLRDEHLDVEGRAVDLTGASRQGGLELLKGQRMESGRWVIPPLPCGWRREENSLRRYHSIHGQLALQRFSCCVS